MLPVLPIDSFNGHGFSCFFSCVRLPRVLLFMQVCTVERVIFVINSFYLSPLPPGPGNLTIHLMVILKLHALCLMYR